MALVAYWKFNEDAGDAIDSSGNGHTLTNTNVTYGAGKLNNCSIFNGTTSKFIGANSEDWNFGTGTFTIAIWIRSSANGAVQHIACNSNTWITAGCWGFWLAEQVWFGSSAGWLTGVTDIVDGNWHRVVVVREGTGANQLKIYLDGNPVPDKTGTNAVDFNNSTIQLTVGLISTNRMDGDMDDFRIYKGEAWTTDDVEYDWNDGNGREISEVTMQINIGDAWKDVDSLKINIGDAWKDVSKVQINIGDVWKDVFG